MKKYVENGVWDNVFWIDQCTFSVFCFGYIKKISFFLFFYLMDFLYKFYWVLKNGAIENWTEKHNDPIKSV